MAGSGDLGSTPSNHAPEFRFNTNSTGGAGGPGSGYILPLQAVIEGISMPHSDAADMHGTAGAQYENGGVRAALQQEHRMRDSGSGSPSCLSEQLQLQQQQRGAAA